MDHARISTAAIALLATALLSCTDDATDAADAGQGASTGVSAPTGPSSTATSDADSPPGGESGRGESSGTTAAAATRGSESGGAGPGGTAAEDELGDEGTSGGAVDCGEPADFAGQLCFDATAQVLLPPGISPLGLGLGDLDGDGDDDLVVAEQTTGSFSAFESLGNGWFLPGFGFVLDDDDLPPHPFAMGAAIGDVTGDGYGDVLVSFTYIVGDEPNRVRVFEGDGAYGFTWLQDVPTPVQSRQIVTVDLDADDYDDAVMSGFDGGIGIALGGEAGLGEPSALVGTGSDSTGGIAVGDVDGDGLTDIVATTPAGIDLHRGLGGGSFAAALAFAGAPAASGAIALGDIDGDGRLDAFVSVLEASAVVVYPGTEAGFGTPTVYDTGVPPLGLHNYRQALDVGDIDADGELDVAVRGATGLVFLRGDGRGGLGASEPFALGGEVGHLRMRDLDGDGVAQIIGSIPGIDSMPVLGFDPCVCAR